MPDLKHSNCAVARDLVASADMVIENFRPRVMERLGLGHSRAIVGENWLGPRFSQLVHAGIFAEKLPAGMPPSQQRPAEGMAAR